MVTCHCKTLESSTKPAEKPSIGFRVKSVFIFRIHSSSSSSSSSSSNQKRKRKKSVQNVGVASSLSSFNHHHRPHHNHHHHHHRRERERERETKRQNKRRTRKTTHLSAGFLTKAPLGRSFSFLLSFRACFYLSGLFFITRENNAERSNTNFFGEDESLQSRLVFNNKSSSSESCVRCCYSQRYYYSYYYYYVCLCVCESLRV